MKRIKLLGLLLFTVATVNAQEGHFVKAGTMDELFAKAKKGNKMFFVLPEVKKLMGNNFLSTEIDFMTEDLGKQLQVEILNPF